MTSIGVRSGNRHPLTTCHRAWATRTLYSESAANVVVPSGREREAGLTTSVQNRNASSRCAGPHIGRIIARCEVTCVYTINTDAWCKDRTIVDRTDGCIADRALCLSSRNCSDRGRKHQKQRQNKCFCFHTNIFGLMKFTGPQVIPFFTKKQHIDCPKNLIANKIVREIN